MSSSGERLSVKNERSGSARRKRKQLSTSTTDLSSNLAVVLAQYRVNRKICGGVQVSSEGDRAAIQGQSCGLVLLVYLPDRSTLKQKMTTAFPQVGVLDTPEGETALLTAIINARPVGMAKHWAMVSILLYLEHALGEGRVTSTDVWNKLRTLYDLDLLDEDVSDGRYVPCSLIFRNQS